MDSMVKSKRYISVVAILEKLGLDPNHAHVLMTSNPLLHAPYHNTEHCFTVAINSYKAAKYYNLSMKQTTALFLAALYHDYDHAAGTHY